jgi:arylsulfatase A-like enzyme
VDWQGDRSHAAGTQPSFEQPISMSYGPRPTYFYPYSSWGWFDQEAHVPSYFRPQYIEYASPRYTERLSFYKDYFDQIQSRAQSKKKMLKQFYRVKYDAYKNKSSDLNATIEKLIALLKNSAIDGKK